MADSFLKASHITRTRHAHQVTAAALFILQKHAYEEYKTAASPDDMLDFDGWCLQQQQAIRQFKYWSLTLELILTILIFVRSLRMSDFGLYIDSLTQLTPWLSALDHTNYARYLPVHIRNMIGLESKHPEIAQPANPTQGPDATVNTEAHKYPARTKAPEPSQNIRIKLITMTNKDEHSWPTPLHARANENQ